MSEVRWGVATNVYVTKPRYGVRCCYKCKTNLFSLFLPTIATGSRRVTHFVCWLIDAAALYIAKQVNWEDFNSIKYYVQVQVHTFIGISSPEFSPLFVLEVATTEHEIRAKSLAIKG